MSELTILMPCLNEGASLAFCVREAAEYLRSRSLDGEILVADNGSSDGSPDVARRAGARVVHVPQRGYGAALLGGIRAAEGRYVIFGDADGSYDFSALDPFVDALRGGAALVVGDRFSGGIEPGAMPVSHRLGVKALSALGRWRFHTHVADFHCGLRGIDRAAALSLGLCCPGMEFATELIAAFAQEGATIAQVPTPLRRDRRQGGKSHLRALPDGWRHLQYILFSARRNLT